MCEASLTRGVRRFFTLLISPVSSALNTSSAAWVPERAPSQISAFGSFSRTKRWKIWSSLEEDLPIGENQLDCNGSRTKVIRFVPITANASGSLKPAEHALAKAVRCLNCSARRTSQVEKVRVLVKWVEDMSSAINNI
jgi:hypothetical protein